MNSKRQQLLESGNLPTLPTAAVRLLELSKSPEAGIADLCDTIKSDPAISIRVIRAANSSYFGLRNEVTSIEKAAMMLGPGMLTTITLTFYLAQQSVSSGPAAQHYGSFWLRTVIQATAAESILEFSEQEGRSAAFLAGLVCDIGHLAMLRVFPESYADFVVQAKEDGQPISEIERRELGFDHLDIGIDLADKWGLPKAIVDSITYHHLPAAELKDLTDIEDLTTLKSAIVGSAVADHLCGGGAANTWHVLRASCQELFGLSDNEIVDYLSNVHDRIECSSGLFGIDPSELPDLTTIMSEAAELLTENAIEIQVMTNHAMSEKQALEEAKVELERENSEMHHRMIRDALTGVFSRSYFEEHLSVEMKKCNRSGSPLGLIFCDIDHFKSLNDRYGHPFGDHVLQLVAKTLQSVLRGSDVVARYGGEEFVVILNTESVEGLSTVAEKMRRTVDQLRIRAGEDSIRVSISAGACFAPRVVGNLETLRERLVRDADAAMYIAKRNGRNQIHLAQDVVPEDTTLDAGIGSGTDLTAGPAHLRPSAAE